MNLHSSLPMPSCARALIAVAGALPSPTRIAAGAAPAPGAEIVAAASGTPVLVAGLLVVVILLPVAFLACRRLFGVVRGAPADAAADDPVAAAEAEVRRGHFAAAAERFDAAGDRLRAAGCWERARDLPRAAAAWEVAGELERAAALHVRSGGSLRAAGIYMRTRNYGEAAKIFRDTGAHLRAAQALELLGDAVAAAREYSAAGNHARAARLLEAEGMYAEAAEACRPLLGGGGITAANAAQHTTYAALLALAGDRERAAAVYRDVLAALPGNLRAASGLQSLATRPPAPGDAAPSMPRARAGSVRAAPGDIDFDIDFLEPAEPPRAPGDRMSRRHP